MHDVALRDGERPVEFRRIAREQSAKYGSATLHLLTWLSWRCAAKISVDMRGSGSGAREEMIGKVRNWCSRLVVEIERRKLRVIRRIGHGVCKWSLVSRLRQCFMIITNQISMSVL